MANQLRKLGYSLSNAFKTAWRRIKEGMTVRVQGVTFDNRQKLLQFIAQRKPSDLTTYLRRDRANTFDKYAVAVVIGVQGVGYAHIGYLPRGLSQIVAVVLDAGMKLKADMQIIGGYGQKETYGALLNIAGFKCQRSSKGRSFEAVLEESQGVLSPFFFPLGVFFILGNRSFGERLLESSCQIREKKS